MRNQAVNPFGNSTAESRSAMANLRTDQNPAVRLVTLLLVFVLIVGVILYRLFYIQTELSDNYAALFGKQFVTEEPIPSLDGQILTQEGLVLAEDRQVFNVTAHFRWLEEPPNENWLKRHARSRLTAKERRNKELVEQQKQVILQERAAMWSRLAKLTGSSIEELLQQRQKIQTKIERQKASVEKRQQAKRELAKIPEPQLEGKQSWWGNVIRSVKHELTTTPHRSQRDPLVIREELEYHAVVENVSLKVATQIKSHPNLYPGLNFKVETERHYPQRDLAAHIIGVRRPLTVEQFQARQKRLNENDPLDYQIGDRIGLTGLEKRYDRQLHGIRGLRKIVKNRHGEILSDEIVRSARKGKSIVLSLNSTLQRSIQADLENKLGLVANDLTADRELSENEDEEAVVDEAPEQMAIGEGQRKKPPAGGAVVVLDVRTGAVVAAVSAPGFDLELMTHPENDLARWKQLQHDKRSPFMTRFTQMAVAPGSVFKTMTSVAILQSGRWNPDKPTYCQGFLHQPNKYRCYIYSHYGHGHDEMNLVEALCQSCNVYYFTAAEKLTAKPILEWSRKLGFGKKTGIDLPGERKGNLPNLKPGDVGYSGNSRGLAIGQSRLTTTPIQIARMMAFVANGGELVTPYLVDSIGNIELGTHQQREPQVQKVGGVDTEMLARVREGLWMVVQNKRGTAYKHVRLDEVTIAGKTGTAEVGAGRRDHAWFAGYVPADRPKYAFAVVLEHAGSGGKNAGPVAKELVQSMLNLGMVGNSQLAKKTVQN